MKKFVTVLLLLLSGCSTTLPMNYIPSTASRGDAAVSVGEFHYLPADQRVVEPNEFQKANGSIGTVYISDTVSNTVHNVLKKELAYAGYKLNSPDPLIISGDVTRFYYNWIGFTEVNFEVGITFRVEKNGSTVLELATFSHQKAPKGTGLAQNPEAIRSAVSECVDQFLEAAHAQNVM